jgi:hypothetical protein
VNDEIRKVVWPLLLNAEVINPTPIKEDDSWEKFGKKTNKDSD